MFLGPCFWETIGSHLGGFWKHWLDVEAPKLLQLFWEIAWFWPHHQLQINFWGDPYHRFMLTKLQLSLLRLVGKSSFRFDPIYQSLASGRLWLWFLVQEAVILKDPRPNYADCAVWIGGSRDFYSWLRKAVQRIYICKTTITQFIDSSGRPTMQITKVPQHLADVCGVSRLPCWKNVSENTWNVMIDAWLVEWLIK